MITDRIYVNVMYANFKISRISDNNYIHIHNKITISHRKQPAMRPTLKTTIAMYRVHDIPFNAYRSVLAYTLDYSIKLATITKLIHSDSCR